MDSKTDSDVEDSLKDTEETSDYVVKTSTNYLKHYAATKGHSLHSISQMPPEQLADYLKDFYTQVKTKDDGSGMNMSMRYIRNGLHKYFEKHHDVDILKDKAFDHANAVFEVASRQGPRRCHRLRIEYDDLKKIYLGQAMNLDQPDTLQNKIFFDVNLYICNRGKDFLRVMCKSDFVVERDKDERRYVWLKYHPKFSFNELVGGVGDVDLRKEGTQIGERMYERPGDPRCPVTSFLHYLTHLHPMTEAFWQRPKRSFVASDYVWFDNTPLGNSTLSKILTRICHAAGLYENYTNHAIKSSYIQLIENMCKEAINAQKRAATLEMGRNSPALTNHSGKNWEDKSSPMNSTADSESKDMGDENKSVGLTNAKMKVLEMVHSLEVKDIKSFVDWMKTFRVELDNGGLVVLCSPVDQKAAGAINATDQANVHSATDSKGANYKKATNGKQSRESSPFPTKNASETSSVSSVKSESSKGTLCKESSQDDDSSDFGIAIRQVEFDSVSTSYCSMPDAIPMKVTIPCQNTVLVTGVQDSVQILLHNREGPPLVSEPMHSRIFYSQHEMDVAVVTALLSARNSLKSNSSNVEKVENSSRIQDKFKPMKKRNLTEMRAIHSSHDTDCPPNKHQILRVENNSFMTLTPGTVAGYQRVANVSNPTMHQIQAIPIYSPVQEVKGVSLLPKVQLKASTRHHPSILPVRSHPTEVKIKKEPIDKD